MRSKQPKDWRTFERWLTSNGAELEAVMLSNLVMAYAAWWRLVIFKPVKCSLAFLVSSFLTSRMLR